MKRRFYAAILLLLMLAAVPLVSCAEQETEEELKTALTGLLKEFRKEN